MERRRARRRAAARARRGAPRQDDHARVRLEGRHRQPAVRRHAQSVEPGEDARRLERAAARRRSPRAMGPLAIGTDGGGSIRIPVPRSAGSSASSRRSAACPLAAVALRHGGARRPDDAQRRRRRAACSTWSRARRARLARPALRAARLRRTGSRTASRDLRIAYSPNLGVRRRCDPRGRRHRAQAAIDVFADLGARVEEAAPGLRRPAERSSARTVVQRRRARVLSATAKNRSRSTRASSRSPRRAREISAAELPGDAPQKRGALAAHEPASTATTTCWSRRRCRSPPSTAGRETPEARAARWTDWTPFTYPFNLTQQPAASVPCGFTRTDCRSACRSSGRATPTRWCCARRAHTSRRTRSPRWRRSAE